MNRFIRKTIFCFICLLILNLGCVSDAPRKESVSHVAQADAASAAQRSPLIRLPDGAELSMLDGSVHEAEPIVMSPEEMAAWEALNNNPDAIIPGIVWVGEMGVTESVEQIMARAALEDAAAVPRQPESLTIKSEIELPWRKHRPQNPASPQVSRWSDIEPLEEQHEDQITPNREGTEPRLPQTLSTAFDVQDLGTSGGFIPPDTVGDVGPTQYLSCSNGRLRVHSKAGVLGLNTTLNGFFQSVRNGFGTSDPRVRFDRTTNRWFVSCINLSLPNRVLLAVSSGPTVNSTANFTFYFFQHDLVGTTPNSDTGGLLDFPSLGVDNNAVYIGGNVFNSSLTSYIGSTGFVVRKSSVTSGGPIVVTAFRQIVAGTGAGPFAPMGVSNDDTVTNEGYFIGADNAAFGRLAMRRVSSPGGTPTISGNILITVPATNFPTAVPVLGSTRPLDAIDDRLFLATIHLNQLTGLRTLWTAHNFRVTTAGIASSTGNRIGCRWYELQNLTATPTVRQSGTVFDSATTNFNRYWMPTVAMTLQGHAVFGSSVGGDARRAEIAVTGRLASQTLGQMDTPPVIAQGTTFNYNVETSGTQRWGDYSMTSVDPTDGMTIWTNQQYCNATNSWAMRVFKVLAPPPAMPSSANPPSVPTGATNVNVQIIGTSSAGSGFFDPDPSYPNHIAATVNGGGVTVNSITFTNPTDITLNLTVSNAAATGLRTISVTNPDGQSITSAPILNIIPSCILMGDLNEDTLVDGIDIDPFVQCLVNGTSPGHNCACGDFNGSTAVDAGDIPGFLTALGI